MSPESIAADVGEVLGVPLTVRHVALVKRAGMRSIGEALRSRGLSAPLRVRKVERPDDSEDWDLIGWGDVAGYLSRSTASAQMLATREANPLPVTRTVDGVRAMRADVLAWIQREAA